MLMKVSDLDGRELALNYSNTEELMASFKNGARFLLHYHGDTIAVREMTPGNNCVWVSDKKMLPVHIRLNGSNKDSHKIWMTEAIEIPDELCEVKP